MRRIWSLLVPAIVMFAIAACNDADNLDFDAEDVSVIQVVEWRGGANVVRLEDREFIEVLVDELDSANTASTANLDLMMPEYRLEFRDDQEIIAEFGYYKEVMRLGVEGRYWNRSEQLFYEVDRELPLDQSSRVPVSF